MGNKKTLFTSYFEEKSKNWRLLITRFKFRHCHAIKPNQTEAEAEEQHKHAMTVAIATAAAAEAAVAAANAAAEVVCLTNNVRSQSAYRNLHLSAITIQSAYIGYLARKALSALKGIVKLQALVRGELVRRRVIKRLALQQPLECPRRSSVPISLIDHFDNGETRHGISCSEELNLHLNNNKSCDLSLVSKKEALCPRKQDTITKTAWTTNTKYSSSLRERRNEEESVTLRASRSNRFDPCTESKFHQHDMLSHSKDVALDATKLKKLKLRGARKQGTTEDLMNSSFCHVKQKSIEDDRSLPNSPVLRAYMAPTESAKAKSRSLSTPRRRLRLSVTCYGQDDSPHKLSVSSSLLSSFNGEVTSTKKRNSISQ